MKFEGTDSVPPYMRAPERRSTSEMEAYARLKFLYSNEVATLERYKEEYRRTGKPTPDSEKYRVVLERVNALGKALNGVPGMYEHIDLDLSETDRIKKLKKIILEQNDTLRAELKQIQESERPNIDRITEINNALKTNEERLTTLDELLITLSNADADRARHQIREPKPSLGKVKRDATPPPHPSLSVKTNITSQVLNEVLLKEGLKRVL